MKWVFNSLRFKAIMKAKLSKPSIKHVISMMQAGSVFATTQTIVTEVSETGGTMMRKYSIRQARETQERVLVYRRKP